jgi:5-methylcytosine-specific restriction endonuclease McrA
MVWLRVGDTFATDPRVLALNDPAAPLMGPACRGFFLELAALSANSSTDYVITRGQINLAGGAVAPHLLRRCERVGLIRPLDGRGPSRRWKLIDDAPELIHIRLAAEVAWEKQQKADTQNHDLQTAVWLRDGDACRWCGRVVQPSDNKSARGKTLDHLEAGQKASGPQDLVVACRGCNGRRGKEWLDSRDDEAARADYVSRWQLRPPPSPLIFIRSTVDQLAERGYAVPANTVIAERAKMFDGLTTSGPEVSRPASQTVAAAPARSTTAPGDQHPALQVGVAAPGAGTTGATHPTQGVAAPPSADQHPASQAGVAAPNAESAPATTHPAPAGVAQAESRTDHRSPTDRSGAGRVGVGSGRVGSSPPGPPAARSPDPPAVPATTTSGSRRTRRGRRRQKGATSA